MYAIFEKPSNLVINKIQSKTMLNHIEIVNFTYITMYIYIFDDQKAVRVIMHQYCIFNSLS